MSGTLRRPYDAIVRPLGGYVAGEYVQAPEPAPVSILAGIQPATAGEYQIMQPNPEGRRVQAMFRIYTSSKLNVAGKNKMPGDIVISTDGTRLLIIGEQDRHVLMSDVSHYKYYAVAEIEHVNGETTL